jgi:hypothetical protein
MMPYAKCKLAMHSAKTTRVALARTRIKPVQNQPNVKKPGLARASLKEFEPSAFVSQAPTMEGKMRMNCWKESAVIFGGGGCEFDQVAQKFAHAGVGIEFRFTPHAGVFADARYVFADKTDNYGVVWAGLRFSF